jgi:DNA-binding response OmpR family regulator
MSAAKPQGAPLPPNAGDAVSCGPLWVSPNEMCEVRVGGHRVPMSVRHVSMLAVLLAAEGRVVSQEDLYARSGGGRLPERSRTVAVHVARIRSALGALGRYLIAVPQRGYRIDVTGLAAGDPAVR